MRSRRSARCGIIGVTFALLSLLRPSHLDASPVKADETVVFLSGIGNQQSDGWNLDIHGWVYESEYHKPITSLFRRAVGIRDDELTRDELATFRERAQFFLVDNERHKSVSIRLGEMTFTLAPSRPNGHFQTNLHILSEDVDRFGLASLLTNRAAPFQMLPPKKNIQPVNGVIELLPATGISVISDIDDTIKVSDVRERKELLRNTFCRPYQAVPGMAEQYRKWEKSAGARFHYVSATPWQLYLPLSEFIRSNRFPEGTFQLKLFRWKDQTFFDLFKSPEHFKLSAIRPLFERFPNRKFVLVGDSGEKDPEIYAALAREFPQQVTHIYIRDTTSQPQDSARYRSTFSGLSTNRWQIFRQPSELPDAL